MGVRKSVDEKTRLPSVEELTELLAERLAPPKVYAYEIARELGTDPGAVSKFENGRGTLPHGMGVKAYRQALARLKRVKRGGESAA